MDKKKILIVSSAFYPQNSPRAFRTTELAKELSRQGHEVVVYIPDSDYDYSAYKMENRIDIRFLGKGKWKEIEIKGSKIIKLIRRLLRRGLGLLVEYPKIELMFNVSRTLKKEMGYDMLISIAVPYSIHWGVAKLKPQKTKLAKTWVADCGDPYMGETADSFNKMFYFKYVEQWFCKMANYITIPFEGAKSAYYSEFHHKIKIIPQGFRLDELNLPKYEPDPNCIKFAYAGGFIPGKRDPRKFLDFLTECNHNFKFTIYTSDDSLIAPFKDKLKEKLIVKPYIPREELLKVLASMDFLVNFDNNTKTQLPSKLIDYAITGRPVFNVAADTKLLNFVQFLEGNYSHKMALEHPESYNIREVAKKFVSLNN